MRRSRPLGSTPPLYGGTVLHIIFYKSFEKSRYTFPAIRDYTYLREDKIDDVTKSDPKGFKRCQIKDIPKRLMYILNTEKPKSKRLFY